MKIFHQMIDEAYNEVVKKLPRKAKEQLPKLSALEYKDAELKRIFVDSSCKGLGLGSKLVRCLEAKAKMKAYR